MAKSPKTESAPARDDDTTTRPDAERPKGRLHLQFGPSVSAPGSRLKKK